MKSLLVLLSLVAFLSTATLSVAQDVPAAEAASAIAEGKRVAVDRKKGNCLACHMMDDGEMPGLAGPPLIMMKQRFPESAKLREQIWDATIRNPKSRMPPFGRHGILSEQEIDQIVEYLYTL